MYYENKRTFYLKQYGPAIVLVFIALILIGTGIYIAFKPNSNDIIANNDPSEIVNSYVLSDQAYEGKVISTNGLGITVEANGITSEVYLIGVRQSKYNQELSNQISKDLVNKTVTVDFDSVKLENDKVYAYIYIDGTLYNETLLAQGQAELRPERQNINKLDILLAAELEAQHNGIGIWEY